MIHLKDTIIYGDVQIETASIYIYEVPEVNNLPILFTDDISAELFDLIANYHIQTETALADLKRKATIGGASQ